MTTEGTTDLNDRRDPKLDTADGCVEKLGEQNAEMGEFGAAWWQAVGELAKHEKAFTRIWRVAMRQIVKAGEGSNKESREALCHEAVVEMAPNLLPRIEELTEVVESGKVRMKLVEQTSSNTQSALKKHLRDADIARNIQPRMAA